MKTEKIFWGLVIILLAVALLLDGIGLLSPLTEKIGELSFFVIVCVLLLVAYTVARVCRGKVKEIFVPLALIFMLLEKNIATALGRSDPNMINNWLLLGCAVLLQIGFSILFSHWKVKINFGENTEYEIEGDGLHTSAKSKAKHTKSCFTSSVRYIDGETFGTEWVEGNMASTVIRFKNAEKYAGDGTLHLENNLGSMVVELPAIWRFDVDIENSFGSVVYPSEKGDPTAPLVVIRGENNLGSIHIKCV